jgi:UPF0755 protein
MKKKLTAFLVVISILAIVSSWFIFGPTISNSNKKFLYISEGADFGDVENNLKENDFLSSTYAFRWISKAMGYSKNIRPGKYQITDRMSLFSLVRMLKNGRQAEVRLVITKLRTREDFAKKINEKFDIDYEEAMLYLNSNDSLKTLGVDTSNLMTLLIPNSYLFWWNTSLPDLLKRLQKQHDYFWEGERTEKAKALGFSTQEIYTIASIVEEETNKKEDKGKIARVYMNRIKKGMKLEADPTVKFAMRNFTLTRIMHKHLDHPSVYNTYYQKGLPPGPICTPSMETIDEVLDSEPSEHIFFVAKPDFKGYSNFSSTYPEHQRFAKAYQKALDSLIAAKKK